MISRCTQKGAKYINQFLIKYMAIGYSDNNIIFTDFLDEKEWIGYSPQLGSRENEILAEEIYSSLQNDLYIGTPFQAMVCSFCETIFSQTVKYCLIDIRDLDGPKSVLNVISSIGNAISERDEEEFTGIFEECKDLEKQLRFSKILEILEREEMNIDKFDIYIKNVVK